jgi:bHLH factor
MTEMIEELSHILPNGSGETTKTAIIRCAVQYIHQLKENEASSIQKWTLEKRLLEDAMGELQVQLTDIRRMWEAEHIDRQRAEEDLEVVKRSIVEPQP